MVIAQSYLPVARWSDPRLDRLPGIVPVDPDEWLVTDDAFGVQMAERARLLATCSAAVLAGDGPDAVALELLDLVEGGLPARGYVRAGAGWRRPDGVTVAVDRARPLWSLGHLVQEDLCIHTRPEGQAEHVLSAAVLCFPASWTLAEKIGHPLTRIHAPVHEYDARLAARVQRLFDAIRPEQPLMRYNALFYDDPALFQPRSESDLRGPGDQSRAPWLRSERQCLRRLPQSGAVVFAIHTWVVARHDLSAAQREALGARSAVDAWPTGGVSVVQTGAPAGSDQRDHVSSHPGHSADQQR